MLFMLRGRRLDERMRDGQSWMESVTANGSSAKFPNVETVSECGSFALWAYSWWVTHHREALGESISPSRGVSASLECGRGVRSYWGATAHASFLTRRSRSTIASAHVARADDRAALALVRGESGAAAGMVVSRVRA